MERGHRTARYLLTGRPENLFKIDHVRRSMFALGQKQTCAVLLAMSAKGRKRTFSILDQTGGSQRLVDHRSDLGDVRHRGALSEYIVVLVEDLAVQGWLRLLISPR